MTTELKPLSEVNYQAIRLLSKHMGVVDTFRFVNQFTTGHGNYTTDREALFGNLTVNDIVLTIESSRSAAPPNPAGDQEASNSSS